MHKGCCAGFHIFANQLTKSAKLQFSGICLVAYAALSITRFLHIYPHFLFKKPTLPNRGRLCYLRKVFRGYFGNIYGTKNHFSLQHAPYTWKHIIYGLKIYFANQRKSETVAKDIMKQLTNLIKTHNNVFWMIQIPILQTFSKVQKFT